MIPGRTKKEGSDGLQTLQRMVGFPHYHLTTFLWGLYSGALRHILHFSIHLFWRDVWGDYNVC